MLFIVTAACAVMEFIYNICERLRPLGGPLVYTDDGAPVVVKGRNLRAARSGA